NAGCLPATDRTRIELDSAARVPPDVDVTLDAVSGIDRRTGDQIGCSSLIPGVLVRLIVAPVPMSTMATSPLPRCFSDGERFAKSATHLEPSRDQDLLSSFSGLSVTCTMPVPSGFITKRSLSPHVSQKPSPKRIRVPSGDQ